jgi:hypothetical protein
MAQLSFANKGRGWVKVLCAVILQSQFYRITFIKNILFVSKSIYLLKFSIEERILNTFTTTLGGVVGKVIIFYPFFKTGENLKVAWSLISTTSLAVFMLHILSFGDLRSSIEFKTQPSGQHYKCSTIVNYTHRHQIKK